MHAFAARLVLGLAQLTKMSCLVIYPAMILVSVSVLNTGYLFDRTFEPIGEFRFRSELLTGGSDKQNRFDGSWLHCMPAPLPTEYLIGFDTQKHDVERQGITFLMGNWSGERLWY